GIGHNAVVEALNVAFFKMRANYVVAKIKKVNERSQNLFKGIGVMEVRELPMEIEYKITMEAFIKMVA
ncbi:N-acetyltransferase, partial [Clostridium sp. HCS.1]